MRQPGNIRVHGFRLPLTIGFPPAAFPHNSLAGTGKTSRDTLFNELKKMGASVDPATITEFLSKFAGLFPNGVEPDTVWYHYVAYGLRHILVAEYSSDPTADGDEWVRSVRG